MNEQDSENLKSPVTPSEYQT